MGPGAWNRVISTGKAAKSLTLRLADLSDIPLPAHAHSRMVWEARWYAGTGYVYRCRWKAQVRRSDATERSNAKQVEATPKDGGNKASASRGDMAAAVNDCSLLLTQAESSSTAPKPKYCDPRQRDSEKVPCGVHSRILQTAALITPAALGAAEVLDAREST
mmetsp:Transcript_27390/g.83306  ORF Transcript_27390/g.83306 Transcript_27390/m.83306 type:complete len:162 (+) Transcript_27390:715-1200(+)|eukprot:scaffold12568_cov35-Tisochrysis_lutea.AAC.2